MRLCGECGKTMKAKGKLCYSCRDRGKCQICREPIKGLGFCPGCKQAAAASGTGQISKAMLSCPDRLERIALYAAKAERQEPLFTS